MTTDAGDSDSSMLDSGEAEGLLRARIAMLERLAQSNAIFTKRRMTALILACIGAVLAGAWWHYRGIHAGVYLVCFSLGFAAGSESILWGQSRRLRQTRAALEAAAMEELIAVEEKDDRD